MKKTALIVLMAMFALVACKPKGAEAPEPITPEAVAPAAEPVPEAAPAPTEQPPATNP